MLRFYEAIVYRFWPKQRRTTCLFFYTRFGFGNVPAALRRIFIFENAESLMRILRVFFSYQVYRFALTEFIVSK